MEKVNSSELIILLQGGNLEALGRLYNRYNQMVYRTAFAIIGDPEVAADLLQDVFLRLHRYAARVDPTRPLEPWLYRVTTNLAYTWVKRRRWLRPWDEVAEWLLIEKRTPLQQQIEMDDDWQRVSKAISYLPMPQRVVVVLYYVNDLTIQEISDVLEIPQGTVKSRLHYGRKSLRKLLGMDSDRFTEGRFEFT